MTYAEMRQAEVNDCKDYIVRVINTLRLASRDALREDLTEEGVEAIEKAASNLLDACKVILRESRQQAAIKELIGTFGAWGVQ